ncbi:TniQ family protein [Kitasatospora azatica]|uniref:hypothetical protein n=1 Tax=Kitasatospora azatica TaxID=58347 RepID=UPI0005615300|nr:hypothetical protein [Kitasatospora azatica]
MNTPPTQPPLRPLPVRVRPHLGEGTDSYLRRLARGNHLKPSYLNSLVCPKSRHGKPDIALLAQLADRSATDLRRALADAPGKARPAEPQPVSGEPSLHDVDLLLLTSALQDEGIPLRLAAQRRGLDPKTVRKALQQQEPRRFSRRVPGWEVRRNLIDAMATEGLPTAEIWARMMDDHDTPLTYNGINTYLGRTRSALTHS